MEKQQVKKYTPDTSCTKIPKQLCAPESCNIVEVIWDSSIYSRSGLLRVVSNFPKLIRANVCNPNQGMNLKLLSR